MNLKKYFKRMSAVLCAAILFLSTSAFAVLAESEKVKTPVTAEALHEGTYAIEVTSSASMFRIVECELTVADGNMTADMTLSGKGYEKLYMGTGEQALGASDEDYIYFAEDEEGRYHYTVPVAALNQDIDCAAWSFKRQQWYDRVLVFEADTLPDDAWIDKPTADAQPDETTEAAEGAQVGLPTVVIILSVGAAVVLMAAVAAVVIVRKKKQ